MSTNNKKIKKPKMSKKSCGHHFCQLDTKKTCCICGDTRKETVYLRYEDGKGYVPSNWWWGYCPSCAAYQKTHEGPVYYPSDEFCSNYDRWEIEVLIDGVVREYGWEEPVFSDDVVRYLREHYWGDERILEFVYGEIERQGVIVPSEIIARQVLCVIRDRRRNLSNGFIVDLTRILIDRYLGAQVTEMKRLRESQMTVTIGNNLNEKNVKERNRKILMAGLHDRDQLQEGKKQKKEARNYTKEKATIAGNHKTEKATIAEKERIFEDLCGCSMTTIQKVLIPCGHLSCEECATQSNCLICGVELVTKLSL
eukprot:TRINITY_DN1024_c0_g1_i3.p1 TRINITY_DN1024_c0_g1~~TRINITY_DN1024_c0_g1_i3.p1  ORF type:complete len:310 (-),score=56.77 TRINITY_DN1024_c0_g1_i3:40-969(-)